jgi:hypothetical protein
MVREIHEKCERDPRIQAFRTPVTWKTMLTMLD